jgi:hypothetical protein
LRTGHPWHIGAASQTWPDRAPEFAIALDRRPGRRSNTLDENLHSLQSVERLRAFLTAQPKEDLVSRLLDTSNVDAGFHRELWHWLESIELAQDPHSLSRLTADMMTPQGSAMTAADVPHHVRRASKALPLLCQLIERDADAAARVLENAMVETWTAICEFTDDEQDAPELALSLTQLYLKALKAACPQPPDFAQRLVQLLRADPFGHIDMGRILAVIDEAAVDGLGRHLEALVHDRDQRAQEHPVSGLGIRKRAAALSSEQLSIQRELDQLRSILMSFNCGANTPALS